MNYEGKSVGKRTQKVAADKLQSYFSVARLVLYKCYCIYSYHGYPDSFVHSANRGSLILDINILMCAFSPSSP